MPTETDHEQGRSPVISCCAVLPLDQVTAGILPDQQTLKVSVRLPKTFLNERQPAVSATKATNLHAGMNCGHIPAVIVQAHAFAYVQAHRDCLFEYKKATKGSVDMEIDLPFKVDKAFAAVLIMAI